MFWFLILAFLFGFLWYTDHLDAFILFIKEVYDWVANVIFSYDWSSVKAVLYNLMDILLEFLRLSYNFIITHPQESKGFFLGILAMYVLLKITHWFHSPKVVVKHR